MFEGMTVTPSVPDQSAVQPVVNDPAHADPNPAPEVPEVPKPDEDSASSKFAALARREKIAQKRIQEAKDLETKIKEREAAIAEREARLQAFEEKRKGAKLNPKAFLEESGLSYQEITEFFLNDEKPSPDLKIKSVEEKFEAFKREQEEREAKAAEEEARIAKEQAEAQIEAFKGRLSEFIDSNPDEYELIQLHGQQDLVFETIQSHFEKTKKVLSNKEAADLVEKYLEEQVEKSIATKKLQSRFAKQTPDSTETKAAPKGGSTTLTNSLTSSSAPSILSPKSENDRMARALAKLNGA